MMAAAAGHAGVLQALLAAGANANATHMVRISQWLVLGIFSNVQQTLLAEETTERKA